MSEQELDEFYRVCYELVKECGKVVCDGIGKAKNIQTKSCDIDFVTETDQEVEKLLIGGLMKHFPTHKFIGEESVAAGIKCVLSQDPTWIIDPIDGTTNYVHTMPLVAISVGLLIKKIPVIGIIYNPLLDQMFTARLGKGAFLNGEPIHVSSKEDLSQALICSEVGTGKDPARIKVIINNLKKLIGNVHGIRALGSAALNMASVATGGTDAYYELGIHAWDMAAGWIIVQEAGGILIDISGGPFDILSRRVICASSMKLAKQLAGLLEEFELERD